MSLSRRKTSLGFSAPGERGAGAQKTRLTYCLTRLQIQGTHCLCRTIECFLNPESLEIALPCEAWECSQLAGRQDQWHRLSSKSAPLSLYFQPPD